jgi:hypothetical protein
LRRRNNLGNAIARLRRQGSSETAIDDPTGPEPRCSGLLSGNLEGTVRTQTQFIRREEYRENVGNRNPGQGANAIGHDQARRPIRRGGRIVGR